MGRAKPFFCTYNVELVLVHMGIVYGTNVRELICPEKDRFGFGPVRNKMH